MSGNSFGNLFKITSFGESHGKAMGVVIDACPAGLELSQKDIQSELDRRKPGQTNTSPRAEKDQVEILSGVFEGRTLGTPIALLVKNEDIKSEDYEKIKDLYRPGHADFTYEAKFGVRDWRGGGRASARETVARVAAGAVAKKLIKELGIKVEGKVIQVGKAKTDEDMQKEIESAKTDGDSVGGIVQIIASGTPVGLGEPVFDKLSADLAKALMSIPAVKAFEIGDGFAAAEKRGSEVNDEWVSKEDGIGTKTNHAGGIIGGISTGEDIVVRIALKPAPSISKEQKTVDSTGQEAIISVPGRHDPCVCTRAVPVAEAMMALVLADHFLLNQTSQL